MIPNIYSTGHYSNDFMKCQFSVPSCRVRHIMGVSLGLELMLLANFRQGCKSLEGKDALTFFGGGIRKEEK